MQLLKRYKIWGVCLAALSLMSVFAFGAGNASASGLLFEPHSGLFPYHLLGLAVANGKLVQAGGSEITSTAVHVLALILNLTLFHVHLLFLGVRGAGGLAGCSNTSNSEAVLLSMLGHLGLAHHRNGGIRHAVLLLVPAGFSFVCEALGVKETVTVSGSVVGEITKPAAGVASEELGIRFKQESGKQLYTLFLFSGGGSVVPLLLSKQGEKKLEESAQEEPEVALHALPGQGTGLLILDP